LGWEEPRVSERRVWRRLYDSRETLFLDGVAVGDFYRTTQDVYRVRLWPEDRLQGGRERLVLASAGEETAREVLLGMLRSARGEAGE
jgi:hypothetical protein